jgi:hypothetical protein
MKPNSERHDDRSRRNFSSRGTGLPLSLTDCNFQGSAFDRYYGGSTGSSRPSFLNISREYFRSEARRNFLAEIAFFLAIAAILVTTFISGARAIIHFLHLPVA